MGKLILRKLLFMLLLIPVLNIAGFGYAVLHHELHARPSRNNEAEPEVVPFWEQYTTYLGGVLHGDFGMVERTPVTQMIKTPLRNSLVLLSISFVIITILGPLLGFAAISSKTKRQRPKISLLMAAGASAPGFMVGAIIIAFLIYRTLYTQSRTMLLPPSGFGFDAHLVLPLIVLSLRPLLQVAQMSAHLIEHELQQDYIRVARSKGLSWRHLFWRHALPNALAPMVTTIGQGVRLMVSGLLVAEAMFDWPGIGKVFTQALGVRLDGRGTFRFYADPNLIAALAVTIGLLLLTIELITSIATHLADPRLRQQLDQEMESHI